jgi:hypothetical protein
MTDADMAFRATKDIDMIVVLEDRYMDFARVFYTCWQNLLIHN